MYMRGASRKVQSLGMAGMLEPLKLDALAPFLGQGFERVFTMALTLNIRGMSVVVFMHELMLYVLLPDGDLEGRDIVLKSEKDILHEVREEFGREIRGVKFFHSYLH